MMEVRLHTHSKIKGVQTLVFSVYAKFAAPVIASDCNLLRLQMMPREGDMLRLKPCHLHDRRLRARYSTCYVRYIHGKQ